jgi:hypothetical protein
MMTSGNNPIPCALSERELGIEACLGLGATWSIGDCAMPPLAAGHFVLLDVSRSPFVREDEPATVESARAAVTIQMYGQDCVQPLLSWVSGDYDEWVDMVQATKLVTDENWQTVVQSFVAQIQYAFGGAEMIHWKDKQQPTSSGGFDLCWLAHQASCICASVPSMTWQDAVWRFPFTAATHLLAHQARVNGATIQRPLDIGAVIKAKMEATA